MKRAIRQKISKSLKAYHKTVRHIAKTQGIAYHEARTAYRVIKKEFNIQKPITIQYLAKHPEIKQEITTIAEDIAELAERLPAIEPEVESIDTIEQWMDLYEPSWEYESPTTFEGTAEYE